MKISAEDIKAKILASTGPNGQQILRRVIVSGQQVLFDQRTHKQAFAGIMENPGKGVGNLMVLLYDKSRPGQPTAQPAQPTGLINAQVGQPEQAAAPSSATMPRGALIPAGAVLLANVAEFADKAGIKPIDEAEFASQLEEMSVVLMDRFDKGFREKVGAKMGGQQVPRGTNPAMPSGGLINNAGGA